MPATARGFCVELFWSVGRYRLTYGMTVERIVSWLLSRRAKLLSVMPASTINSRKGEITGKTTFNWMVPSTPPCEWGGSQNYQARIEVASG